MKDRLCEIVFYGSWLLLVIFFVSCYIYPDRRLDMPVAELLIEEIKTLPENRAAQVLDFVKHIKEGATDDSWFEKGEECPICAKHRDPVTGNPRYNAETVAAIEEGMAISRGEIPAKRFHSLEEMLEDLERDDPDD
jgi:hypothetical protein